MICPRLGLGSPPKEGAGNAGCALHPRSRVQWVEGNAHEHTGSAEALRHSLRNGFTAYTCSPRRRIPFATVASGLRFVQARSGRRVSAGLTSATDARTTRLRRTQRPRPPLLPARCRRRLKAKALKRRSSAQRKIAHGRTRPATTIAPDAAASTASNPASVTIAIRPSCRGGRAK